MSTIALPMSTLDIDYPQQDQVVTSATYSFRVGGPDSLASMEVSVDRGPWRECRRSCGYWWFDWSGYSNGEHTLVARGQNRDGSPVGSTPRRFTVSLRK